MKKKKLLMNCEHIHIQQPHNWLTSLTDRQKNNFYKNMENVLLIEENICYLLT